MWTIDTHKQAKCLFESTAWVNIWHGSVRSGKTVLSLIRWIKFITTFKKTTGEFVMIGKTERTLYRNILNPLMEVFGNQVKVTRGTGEALIFNIRVLLVGANDERAEQKIRGGTFAGAYCDEISLYPESFFTMLLLRLSVEGASLFGTTNPDNPSHWLYKTIIQNERFENKKIFHFHIDDNPNLTEKYKIALRETLSGLWYRRFYLGEWVSAHGAVYDMFDKTKHVLKTINVSSLQNALKFISIDYGIQNACTFGYYYKDKETYYLLDEYFWDGRATGYQKTDGDYVNDLKQWIDKRVVQFIIVDPSATSFIVSLKRAGYVVKSAENSVIQGIQFVSNKLKNFQYFIAESCENTIREIESYVWDEKALNRGIEQPVKMNDHCMDRDRYALFSTKNIQGTSQKTTVNLPKNTVVMPKGII